MTKEEKNDVLEKIKKEIVSCSKTEMRTGICVFAYSLKISRRITDEQFHWVSDILPKQNYKRTGSGYCWKPKAKAPRIRWINQQLELLEKK